LDNHHSTSRKYEDSSNVGKETPGNMLQVLGINQPNNAPTKQKKDNIIPRSGKNGGSELTQ